jgi:hypothetical protein
VKRISRVVTLHLGSVRSANDCICQGGCRANYQAYSRDRRLADPLQPLDGGSIYWETSRALRCTPCCSHHLRERLAGALRHVRGAGFSAPSSHLKRWVLGACLMTTNDSHRYCTCEPQTRGQCGDCPCVKSTGLIRSSFTAPTTA